MIVGDWRSHWGRSMRIASNRLDAEVRCSSSWVSRLRSWLGAGRASALDPAPVLLQAEASTSAGMTSTCRRVCIFLRSEEHTSELQSLAYLVCRLLLEKKKNNLQRRYRPL